LSEIKGNNNIYTYNEVGRRRSRIRNKERKKTSMTVEWTGLVVACI
jgi:hypothetical protein